MILLLQILWGPEALRNVAKSKDKVVKRGPLLAADVYLFTYSPSPRRVTCAWAQCVLLISASV